MYKRPWWRGQFRQRGFRVTVPRETIIKVLSDRKKHMSVEEIFHEVIKTNPGVGLTTVYRTLELLRNMGFVSKLDFGDGFSRYELTIGDGSTHHHHLVCTGCGKVLDYSDFAEQETALIQEIERALNKKYNFVINTHQIHFFGLCKDCRGEQNEIGIV
ncbi:transcriptional repressor [bacterium]|nr:transcriptional repressor [bacterium]